MDNLLSKYMMTLNIECIDDNYKIIKSINLGEINIFDDINNKIIDDKNYIELKLNEINYNKEKIGIYDRYTNVYKTYTDNNCFTDKKLFDIVLDFEKHSRPLSNWFGHIDTSHTFFEGLSIIIDYRFNEEKDINNYMINWGS